MLFWIGLMIETGVMVYFIIQALQVHDKYYPEAHRGMYKETIFPAAMLLLIVSSALVTRFVIGNERYALYIVMSPAILFLAAVVVYFLVLLISRDPWR